MRKYKLNKTKFAKFILGTITTAIAAGLFVWFTCIWIMAA